jgi:hypothetical protein
MVIEKKILQGLEYSTNLCDLAKDIFNQNNRIMEMKYARICVTRRKSTSSSVLSLSTEFPLVLYLNCTKICLHLHRHLLRNIHSHIQSCQDFHKWFPTSGASGFADTEKSHAPPLLTIEFGKINVGCTQLELR